MTYRSLRGTKDILPESITSWHRIEAVVQETMRLFNYHEIRTPVLEQTALFARSIGELTDIVSKEMYTFADRGQESVSLRPEGTAAVLRAFIQHHLGEQEPLVKLYYLGPMFRQERPQAGRLRQFHQFGAEALGGSAPHLDVEMMLLPLEVYRRLGILTWTLKLNSVGCEKCRPAYKERLVAFLNPLQARLSPDSQARFRQNPLRVLDSKDEGDRKLTADAPLIKDSLCEECRQHFGLVRSLLNSLNVAHEVDGRLVRGLDYYTKTAFEISSPVLGSQDALAGGGRYDLLVEELGGSSTPGVGFAAGIERLVMALESSANPLQGTRPPDVYFVAADEAGRAWVFAKAQELRARGIAAEVDYLGRSTKSQMREANRQSAAAVVVIGEQELKSGRANIKDMRSGTETAADLAALATAIQPT